MQPLTGDLAAGLGVPSGSGALVSDVTAGGPAANELLREAQAKRAIQEQQFKVLVEDTIRQANQLLSSDPDAAYEDLKRQREAVLANDSLGDASRRAQVPIGTEPTWYPSRRPSKDNASEESVRRFSSASSRRIEY